MWRPIISLQPTSQLSGFLFLLAIVFMACSVLNPTQISEETSPLQITPEATTTPSGSLASPTPSLTPIPIATAPLSIETLTPTVPQTVSPSQPLGRLAFVDQKGTWLWENGQIEPISPISAHFVAWAPDGRLAYGFGDSSRETGSLSQPPTVILVYNPDTEQHLDLARTFCCSADARWSPDGNYLAVNYFVPAGSAYMPYVALFEVPSGRELLRVCGGQPTFSPDGTELLYATAAGCARGWSNQFSLALLELRNSRQKWLTVPAEAIDYGRKWTEIRGLSWLPDNRIGVGFYDGFSFIFPVQASLLDTNTLRPGLLAEFGSPAAEETFEVSLSWNGQYLAVLKFEETQTNLYLMSHTDSGEWITTQLDTINPENYSPFLLFWSPDDAFITLLARRGQPIYLYSIPDGKLQILSLDPAADVMLPGLTWTPDSRGLSAIFEDTLYWWPVDGSPAQSLLTRQGLKLVAWTP